MLREYQKSFHFIRKSILKFKLLPYNKPSCQQIKQQQQQKLQMKFNDFTVSI